MKLQEGLRGREVELLWKSFYALTALEDLAVELGLSSFEVSYDFDKGVLCVEHKEAEGYLEELNAKYRGRVRVEGPPCGFDRIKSEDLYRLLASRALELSAPLALKVESRLLQTKGFRELALIIPCEEPVILALEGEEDSLTIPWLPAFVFLHTHPSGDCGLSARDRKTFYEFFLSGGFVTGVICGGWAFLVYRLRIIEEEEEVISMKRFLESLPSALPVLFQVANMGGPPLLEARLERL